MTYALLMSDESSSSSEERQAQVLVMLSYMTRLLRSNYMLIGSREDRIPSGLRENVSFETITGWMPEEMFLRSFRMGRESFCRLLEMIRCDIERNVEKGRRSGYLTISADARLGITLRMLAGGSYIDICMAFKVGVQTVYDVFRDTAEALQFRLRLPGLPKTFGELHTSATQFKTSRDEFSPLSGCVGALDGIAVKIRKPQKNQMPAAFYCRKGYYALPVQALVDASYRFLCFSALCVGSTHDSTAHIVSGLGRFLAQGLLRSEFWICGDEAYTCTDSLIFPVPFSQATEHDLNFNYFLSSLRVHVEQAFGQLVARWRIMRDEIGFEVGVCARIVCLCMKLHDFCVEQNEVTFGELPLLQGLSTEESEVVREEFRSWYNDVKEDMADLEEGEDLGDDCVSRKRRLMIDYVKRCGARRPTFYGVPYLE